MAGAPGSVSGGGIKAKPLPQVLSGPASPRSSALSFRNWATCCGVNFGNFWRTKAARPATWGEAWLVPANQQVMVPSVEVVGSYDAVSAQAVPTMSGLTRPSGVGPRLL